VTPFADESLEIVTVMVTLWPCPMVSELPPLKLIEITGGDMLAPPPQPETIAAHRHMIEIETIRKRPSDLRIGEAPSVPISSRAF
jgi:hypothetical protein